MSSAVAGRHHSCEHRSVVVRVRETSAAARSVLCMQVRRLLQRVDVDVVTCDVAGVPANLAALDALARLQLTARRLGGHIRLRGATPDVSRLIDFAGCDDVLPTTPL
jgi:S-adenosylmethionine/arginine decarboxylase-like enzyme